MAENKTVPAKKRPTKKEVMKGLSYECALCGLEVTVDEDCGCEETCDILCCGQPMEKNEKTKVA